MSADALAGALPGVLPEVLPGKRAGATGSGPAAACCALPGATGKYSVKQLPWPGLLCTATLPSWLRITPCTTARPRPVPWPTGLVVKKGSKMRSSVAASMPGPVSRTLSAT